jgi:hypothetical protein
MEYVWRKCECIREPGPFSCLDAGYDVGKIYHFCVDPKGGKIPYVIQPCAQVQFLERTSERDFFKNFREV